MQHSNHLVVVTAKSHVGDNVIKQGIEIAPQTLVEKEFIHLTDNADAPYELKIE